MEKKKSLEVKRHIVHQSDCKAGTICPFVYSYLPASKRSLTKVLFFTFAFDFRLTSLSFSLSLSLFLSLPLSSSLSVSVSVSVTLSIWNFHFNTDFTFPLPPDGADVPLVVELWDEDAATNDDFVGKAAVEENIIGKGKVIVHFLDDAGADQGSGDVSVRLEGEPLPEDGAEAEPEAAPAPAEAGAEAETEAAPVVLEKETEEAAPEAQAEPEPEAQAEPEPEAQAQAQAEPVAAEGEKGTVVVRVESGKVYEKQDLVGKGDPYVIAKVDGQERKTAVLKNTQTPQWDEGVFILLCDDLINVMRNV
jgi:hypothetical protein